MQLNPQPNNNAQNDDKTIILSNNDNMPQQADLEKTSISNEVSEKTVISPSSSGKASNVNGMEATQVQQETAPSAAASSGPEATEKEASAASLASGNPTTRAEAIKKDFQSGKVSTGVFAAGVAGAALAGVGLGAAFSDPISDVFTAQSFDAPQSMEAEAAEVKPDEQSATDGQSEASHPGVEGAQLASYHEGVSEVQGASPENMHHESPEMTGDSSANHETPVHEINPLDRVTDDVQSSDVESVIHDGQLSVLGDISGIETEIVTEDSNSNVYNVTYIDSDGDGDIDSQSMNAHLVDGSTIEFTQTGGHIDPLFAQAPGFADPDDYANVAQEANYVLPNDEGIAANDEGHPLNDSHEYQIQAGDTLSEIADDNHTSVARLMELNPDITDPNVIHANQHIAIPDNDHISNPYEGGIGLEGNHHHDADAPAAPLVQGDSIEATTDGTYADVDWASFNEDSASLDQHTDYNDALSQTDFDGLGSSTGDNDYASNHFDNLDVSGEFM